MIHLSSSGGVATPPPARLDRSALATQIARRRARLTELEAEMIAACEAACGSRGPPNAGCTGERRDRRQWRRYLAAAMRLEAIYGPRMRRLRREISQIERLMRLLSAD